MICLQYLNSWLSIGLKRKKIVLRNIKSCGTLKLTGLSVLNVLWRFIFHKDLSEILWQRFSIFIWQDRRNTECGEWFLKGCFTGSMKEIGKLKNKIKVQMKNKQWPWFFLITIEVC